MQDCRIIPGGSLVAYNCDLDTDIDVSDRLEYLLNETVEIEEGTTLKDILMLLKPYVFQFSPIFTLLPDALRGIIQESEKPGSCNLEQLEMTWSVSLQTTDGEEKVWEHIYFDGIGPPEDENTKEKLIHYAIDFTPINELAMLPVKLNTEYKIIDERDILNHPYPELFKSHKEYTLYDVFFGILNELSFYGYIEDRNDKSDELKGIMKSIEDGTAELKSLNSVEALFKDLESDDE